MVDSSLKEKPELPPIGFKSTIMIKVISRNFSECIVDFLGFGQAAKPHLILISIEVA